MHVDPWGRQDNKSGINKASVKLYFGDYRNKPKIKGKPEEESKTLVGFNYRPLPVNREYNLIDSIVTINNIWYKIKIPTVWVSKGDLIFSFGIVQDPKWSCKR